MQVIVLSHTMRFFDSLRFSRHDILLQPEFAAIGYDAADAGFFVQGQIS
ncbi:MAG: hypothetical protein HGA87_04390 [Desulfobulbaceae bacterium]|nr:hypothetical protein [Desulfobulbaceae bacterium]